MNLEVSVKEVMRKSNGLPGCERGNVIWKNIKDKKENGKVLLFLIDFQELLKFSVVPHIHTSAYARMYRTTNHSVVSIKTGSWNHS